MQLLAIPAFQDNYIWLLHHGPDAVVIDPGEAHPVQHVLAERGLNLKAILVTHHHADHVGGVETLLTQGPATVYAPSLDDYPFPHQALAGGEALQVLGADTDVLWVPGHTAAHLAYVVRPENQAPLLFCGDTLFSAGCGRLFEGTPAQMLDSLDTLAALPDDTRVCCAHEYTLSNLRFALAVEPHNPALQAYASACQTLREQQQPTLPARLQTEREINPFLRVRQPDVIQAIQQRGEPANTPEAVLASLREWKNQFK
jgi:hydroxyacylglutathione hydrolase